MRLIGPKRCVRISKATGFTVPGTSNHGRAIRSLMAMEMDMKPAIVTGSSALTTQAPADSWHVGRIAAGDESGQSPECISR